MSPPYWSNPFSTLGEDSCPCALLVRLPRKIWLATVCYKILDGSSSVHISRAALTFIAKLFTASLLHFTKVSHAIICPLIYWLLDRILKNTTKQTYSVQLGACFSCYKYFSFFNPIIAFALAPIHTKGVWVCWGAGVCIYRHTLSRVLLEETLRLGKMGGHWTGPHQNALGRGGGARGELTQSGNIKLLA